jgi:hypothetical protein
MSKRHELKFSFQGERLAEAAKGRREHHESRLEFWQAAMEQAKAAFREGAVEFREQQITGGSRLTAVFDPERQARLDECQRKLTDHKNAAEEYARWERAFTVNGAADFELDSEDVAFFGL